jgi:DUF4097 and DUF4098 domain-containing protein YvlB
MTHRQLVPVLVAALAGTALPAAAQVYPERIPAATRARSNERAERARERWNQNQGREEQTERTTKTVKIGATGEIDLANVSGDITISRGNTQDATIEIVKTARARTADEAREILGLVTVDVSERPGRAEVRTRYPSGDEMRTQNRRNMNVSVTMTVTAPAGARVTARSVSGNVSSRDIRGEVTLETVSGNVTIVNGGRISGAKTVSGNVDVTGADMDGGIEASSVSGNVALRKGKATRVSLSTVSGAVSLEDFSCQRGELQSVSGDATLSGPLAAGGRYELNSHSGEIKVALSGDTGFELDATSFSGSIRSDLPLTGQTTGAGDRRGRQHSLKGVYGNGSAVLDLNTFSGSIVISKK